MSPILGTNSAVKKTRPMTKLAQPIAIDSPILSSSDSPEWTSSDDEDDNMETGSSSNYSPGGNILSRLPSTADVKPENWRKTATIIKPVRGDSVGSDINANLLPTAETLAGKPPVVDGQKESGMDMTE